MTLKGLIRAWAWTSVLAVLAFAVLVVLDRKLAAATGAGTIDLQSAQTALGFKRVFAAWIAREYSGLAGFNLGFDYLFMPLYGVAFYFSGILAREAFAPKKGLLRRVLNYLSLVPLAGAVADAAENALELSAMTNGVDDQLAQFAFMATTVKQDCFYVGLLLLLAAIAGLVRLRLARKPTGK